MRFHVFHCLATALAVLGLATFSSSAAIHYVNVNGTNAIAPYTNWVTAATNIQDAVDASTNGDSVLVTNGIYATGGRKWFDSGTNRVTLTNAVTLQSVNGPLVTFIVGNRVAGTGPALTNAARCVGMGNNAVLSGFTLTNGEAGWGNYPGGGGVANLTSGTSTVTNCILTGNLATNNIGGGAYRVKLINCLLTRNSAGQGGGAAACTLVNCLVVSNTAFYGGGVFGDSTGGTSSLTNCTIVGNSATTGGGVNNSSSAMDNCIIYYNTAPTGSNYFGAKLNNCCTMPILTSDIGSTSNEPAFMDLANGNYRLQFGSPCINAGANTFAPAGSDLDGNARIVGDTVDIGAYENQNTNPVHFVSISNPAPVSPFTNWMTAATNIQDAIDVSAAGDFVVVSNGIYNVGGRKVNGFGLTNRVAVTKPVTLQSVNGPTVTVIQGNSPIGSSAMRCVYLTNGAALIGFTLTNGATFSSGDVNYEISGGGLLCQSVSAMATNCIFIKNSAYCGGGAEGGTLNNCMIISNSATYGGGACGYSAGFGLATISNLLSGCIIVSNAASAHGGGAFGSTLVNCVLTRNSVLMYQGGGAAYSTLNNCLIFSNSSSSYEGGGVGSSTLTNCTLVGNFAFAAGGGALFSTLDNCIVYYNRAGSSANQSGCTLNYCCITPLPSGSFNFTNAPLFVNTNSDFHLQSNSPCINSGNNSFVTGGTDLDGNLRIAGGTVDIGAYEFQSPASIISYAYLQQYSLPTDGSADFLDSDGDGFRNWQEWRAGTSPTDASSLLQMFSPANTNNSSGVTVSWQSVNGINYFLQRRSDLSAQPPFSTIQSNIVGQNGTTSFTDTKATNPIPYFYRVGVQ